MSVCPFTHIIILLYKVLYDISLNVNCECVQRVFHLLLWLNTHYMNLATTYALINKARACMFGIVVLQTRIIKDILYQYFTTLYTYKRRFVVPLWTILHISLNSVEQTCVLTKNLLALMLFCDARCMRALWWRFMYYYLSVYYIYTIYWWCV